jgi:hypothetical protein
MTEKEKIHEILGIIQEFCEGGNCDYCAFRTNFGECRFKLLAEIHPDSISELQDWLESIDEK